MARSNVPKFGNWEAEENVPYTAYFDKARKTRAPGGKITNPNDPEYNSDSQAPPPSSRAKPEQVDQVRRSREHMRSREDSELKQFGGGDAAGGSSNESATNKKQGRSSQNNSYDNKSPLHKNSYDGTGGRSRPKPTNLRGDESPEKVTVVPKFGDWDENNPASADGYTHIFNKVREERSSGTNVSGGSSRTPTHPISSNTSNTSKCCCFGFGGK